MAKITPGSIVSQVSGKLAGSVFLKGANKAVIRQRVTGTKKQPLTKFGTSISQTRFNSFARNWRSLTQAQRDTWTAAAPKFPTTDKLGQKVILTGMQLYTQLNCGRVFIGNSLLVTAPSPRAMPQIRITAVEIVAGGIFRITYGGAGLFINSALVVRASLPVSPGRMRIRPTELKFVLVATTNPGNPVSLAVLYPARVISTAGKTGQKIFVQIQAVDSASGKQSEGVTASAIIT